MLAAARIDTVAQHGQEAGQSLQTLEYAAYALCGHGTAEQTLPGEVLPNGWRVYELELSVPGCTAHVTAAWCRDARGAVHCVSFYTPDASGEHELLVWWQRDPVGRYGVPRRFAPDDSVHAPLMEACEDALRRAGLMRRRSWGC